MHCLALFASGVEDAVSLSEVDEGVSVESEVACEDESVALGVNSFVERHQIFAIVAVDDNHALVVGGAEWFRTYICSTEASVATWT